ncbi:hypothetical protein [Bradyrhizobium sp.]|uniref:hypothetical protein n=1 Tax=Bradyrhizobium sp. TaxID=376 RepID=UPI0025C56C35|nr:hypothetical protein [Bradyrhizobium sp.]
MIELSTMPRDRAMTSWNRLGDQRGYPLLQGSSFREPMPRPFCGTDRRVIHSHTMMERSLSNLDLDRAIALRWSLRDILGGRFKLLPVKDEDMHTLIELGLVEMRDDAPVVTPAGLAALE